MSKLDQEETDILEAFESGNVKRSKDATQTQKRHREYAKAMFRKDARNQHSASFQGSSWLQKKALAEGIPYQTLVASILHKHVEGRLHETAANK